MQTDKTKKLENMQKFMEMVKATKCCYVYENFSASIYCTCFFEGAWDPYYLENGLSDAEFKIAKQELKSWIKDRKIMKISYNTMTWEHIKRYAKKDKKYLALFEQIVQWKKEQDIQKKNNQSKIQRNIAKIAAINFALEVTLNEKDEYVLTGYKEMKETVCFYDHLMAFKKKNGFIPEEVLVNRKSKTLAFEHKSKKYRIKLKNYEPTKGFAERCLDDDFWK